MPVPSALTEVRNLRVRLAARPGERVRESDFRIEEAAIPDLDQGEVLVEVETLSLDPYMRGRMDEGKNYTGGVALGEVMVGEAVARVVESKSARFAAGDAVIGPVGWQRFAAMPEASLRKLEPDGVPLSAYLGVLGLPGFTGWYGLHEIGRPERGETVVVSAASGAVGSVVGQLAKIAGCRAIGIAGGAVKCEYVQSELGLDACIDYKAGRLSEDLAAATPDGVDVYFDNVGGEVLDAVMGRLNPFSRIPLCGLVSGFGGKPFVFHNFRSLLVNRTRLQGLIATDGEKLWATAVEQLRTYVLDGRLKYRESVADGLENAPKAFIGMLAGTNFGKQLVAVDCSTAQGGGRA
jgi:NADPH-dependent curcumin reductase